MLSAISIQVTIQPLPSEFVHGILRGYKMIYQSVDQHPSTVVVRILEVNQSVVQLTGLNEFANYSVRVSAFTSKGPGPSSAPFYFMTEEDGTVVFIDSCKLAGFVFLAPGQTDATL